MIALIRKELREVIWVPLGFVVFVVAVTVILYLQHYWSSTIGQLYLILWWLFVTYVGCEAFARDGTRGGVEWSYCWPVSRLEWWLAKLVSRGAVIHVVTPVLAVSQGWLASQHYRDASISGGSYALGAVSTVALTGIVAGIALPLLASSVTRTSVQAFGLALLLALAGCGARLLPMRTHEAGQQTAMEVPLRYLSTLPQGLWVAAALGASAYAFVTLPILEYRRKTRRALIPFMAALLLAAVMAGGIQRASDAFAGPASAGRSQAPASPGDPQLACLENPVCRANGNLTPGPSPQAERGEQQQFPAARESPFASPLPAREGCPRSAGRVKRGRGRAVAFSSFQSAGTRHDDCLVSGSDQGILQPPGDAGAMPVKVAGVSPVGAFVAHVRGGAA
jgi:hypothetical protein